MREAGDEHAALLRDAATLKAAARDIEGGALKTAPELDRRLATVDAGLARHDYVAAGAALTAAARHVDAGLKSLRAHVATDLEQAAAYGRQLTAKGSAAVASDFERARAAVGRGFDSLGQAIGTRLSAAVAAAIAARELEPLRALALLEIAKGVGALAAAAVLPEAVKHLGRWHSANPELLLLGLCAYAALRLLEAHGLWHERAWGERLSAWSAALYPPFELRHAVRVPGVPVFLLIGVNLGVLRTLGGACAGAGAGAASRPSRRRPAPGKLSGTARRRFLLRGNRTGGARRMLLVGIRRGLQVRVEPSSLDQRLQRRLRTCAGVLGPVVLAVFPGVLGLRATCH